MSSLNIKTQEFSTPFQIAAHLDIPGLPRITHPALIGIPMPPPKKKKLPEPNGPFMEKSVPCRFYPRISEYDLWMAALSV